MAKTKTPAAPKMDVGAAAAALKAIPDGKVYLACACAPVQAQLKALATGSVVDALSDTDVASVTVPYAESATAIELGTTAQQAWQLFADAATAEAEAIGALEAEFRSEQLM